MSSPDQTPTERTALTKQSRTGKQIVVTATSEGNIIIAVDGEEMYNGPNCPTSPGKEVQDKLNLDPMAGVYGPVVLTGPEIKFLREVLAEIHPESGLQELMNQRAALVHAVNDAGNRMPREMPESREEKFFQGREEAILLVNERKRELDEFEAEHPEVIQRVKEIREARRQRAVLD